MLKPSSRWKTINDCNLKFFNKAFFLTLPLLSIYSLRFFCIRFEMSESMRKKIALNLYFNTQLVISVRHLIAFASIYNTPATQDTLIKI